MAGAPGIQGPPGAAIAENQPTSNRPANPALGQIIFNTTTNMFEGWNGTLWVTIVSAIAFEESPDP